MIDKSIGAGCGIIWQEGSKAAVMRPPTFERAQSLRLLVVDYGGRVPIHYDPGPPVRSGPRVAKWKTSAKVDSRLAWDGLGLAADVGGVFVAACALPAALAVGGGVAALAAGGLALGCVLSAADDMMFAADLYQSDTGDGSWRDALNHNGIYNFVSTWGAVAALVLVGFDIRDAWKLPGEVVEKGKLAQQLAGKIEKLGPEWLGSGDTQKLDELLHHTTEWGKQKKGFSEGLTDLRRLAMYGIPADAVGAAELWHSNSNWLGQVADESMRRGAWIVSQPKPSAYHQPIPYRQLLHSHSHRQELHHFRFNLMTVTALPKRR